MTTPAMGNPDQPAATPATPQPAPVPPVAGAPNQVDPDWLNERLERAKKSAFKEAFGVGDPAEIKKRLEYAAEAQKREEEAKKAQMTEVERLKAEKAEADRIAAENAQKAEQAQLRANCFQVFAQKGIKNFDYGFHIITQRLAAATATGEEVDQGAFLDEVIKDPMQRAALGIADVSAIATQGQQPTTQTRVIPATTTPNTQLAPNQPNNQPAKIPSAMDLDDAGWAKRKSELGLR